jgi:2-polyprenyl-3-methyl-5-hydroxy-6-metoxy-1,4-benzoquinol methylase
MSAESLCPLTKSLNTRFGNALPREKKSRRENLMKKNEYYKMYEFENDYWWYRGLHHLTRDYVERLKRTNSNEELKILDAGCGTGRMMELLDPYGNVEGFDHAEEAVALCKERGLKNAKKEDLNTWNPPTEYYDIIVNNDVIYISTIEDDMAVVGKFHQALKKNGILILNLPAFKILTRKHDIAVFGVRRYRKRKTLAQLKRIGFVPVHASYRLPPLFFIMLLQKYLADRLQKGNVESDLKRLPSFINSILFWMHRVENKIITTGIPLPFGSSLFLVCRKG